MVGLAIQEAQLAADAFSDTGLDQCHNTHGAAHDLAQACDGYFSPLVHGVCCVCCDCVDRFHEVVEARARTSTCSGSSSALIPSSTNAMFQPDRTTAPRRLECTATMAHAIRRGAYPIRP